jgi:mono/diheme cytochrome c family protein
MSTRKLLKFGWCGMLAIVTLLALAACTEDAKPVKGFVLPQGDVAQGEQVFVDFKCHGCHTIPEMEFPKTDFEPPFIISPMPYYGEEMTVAELIDLVEFLHAQYTKLQPQYYRGYYLTK